MLQCRCLCPCFRETSCCITCIFPRNRYFKNAGYLTLGAGKLYHTDNPPDHDVPKSWSPEATSDLTGSGLGPQTPGGTQSNAGGSKGNNTSCDLSLAGDQACYYEPLWHRCVHPASTFCVNTTAAEAEDGSTMRLTIAHLARAKKEDKPFYIGCGFHRPHAAYISTEEHWATYEGKEITAAKHRSMHPSVPQIAMIVNFGIGLENGSHYPWNPIDTPVPVEVQLEVRRHYYAAISWMDELVGGVLGAVDSAGFTDNTVIIFHADHGYFQGESGEWEKKMLFENTARVPLLIHSPGQTHTIRTTELAELVDLYPTVAALAGLPPPPDIDGKDLSSLWITPTPAGSPPLKAAAFSQYPRCPSATNPEPVHKTCFELNDNLFGFMGYSIRVKEWRYTEWRTWDGGKLAGIWNATGLVDQELYDHAGGWPADAPGAFDYEQVNLAVGPEKAKHGSLMGTLAAQLKAHYAKEDDA